MAQAAVKLNGKFDFPKEIFMDRYLERHRAEAMEGRKLIGNLRDECRGLEARLASRRGQGEGSSGGDGQQEIAVNQYLEGTCKFLEKVARGDDPLSSMGPPTDQVENALRVVREMHRLAVEERTELEELVRVRRAEIDNSLPRLRNEGYQLFAVWVHDGLAGSGHYWVYIYDSKTSVWTKFSDAMVKTVEEEEVWSQSVGGASNTSAYFLMYTKIPADAGAGSADTMSIPDALRAEIEGDNEKLRAEVSIQK